MSDPPESIRPTPARVGAGRPIPVREGVPGPSEPAEPPTPSRTFLTEDGSRWEVEVAGRARTGRRGEPGAVLLLLVFRPADGSAAGAGALEALTSAEALTDLNDLALDALRARAVPFRSEPESRGFFPDTRRRSRRD